MGQNISNNGSVLKAMVTLLRRIVVLPRLMKDPSVKLYKKIMVIGGLLYLISPLDLIADPILGFGLIDDTVIMVYIITKIKDELDSYINQENNADHTIILEKDKIIEKVDYKIDDEK